MGSRSAFVEKAISWIGTKEGSKGHKQLVADYNKACGKGRKADINTAWCALFVGAVAEETDNVLKDGIGVPVDCSCGKMIEMAKDAGIWMENDAYVPNKEGGDIIIYDWKDKGKGDDTTGHDHTGIIVSVGSKNFKVCEGNKSDAVGYRTVAIDGQYIRGFIVPKFAEQASSDPVPAPAQPVEPPKPATQKYRIKTNSGLPLRMREQPTTNSGRITSIDNGKTIEVSEIVEGESIGGNNKWAKASYKGMEGYCSMKYLVKV